MFSLLLISLTISMAVGQTPPHPTDDGIACEECVREMHRFGYQLHENQNTSQHLTYPRTLFNQHHRQLIHDGREVMAGYLAENYCPTLEEHAQDCPENLAGHYPDMVNAVVDRCVAFSLSIYCQDPHLQDCNQVHCWRARRPPHVSIHERLQAC